MKITISQSLGVQQQENGLLRNIKHKESNLVNERTNVNISMSQKEKHVLDNLILYACNKASHTVGISKVVRHLIKFCYENREQINFEEMS